MNIKFTTTCNGVEVCTLIVDPDDAYMSCAWFAFRETKTYYYEWSV